MKADSRMRSLDKGICSVCKREFILLEIGRAYRVINKHGGKRTPHGWVLGECEGSYKKPERITREATEQGTFVYYKE